MKITLRIATDSDELRRDLVAAWLEDEGVTLRVAGRKYPVDLTYVHELEE